MLVQDGVSGWDAINSVLQDVPFPENLLLGPRIIEAAGVSLVY